MVNVYFCVVNDITLPILEDLRQMRCPNIKLWFDLGTCTSNQVVKYMKDKENIIHASIDNNLSYFQWDICDYSVQSLEEPNGHRHLVSRSVVDKSEFVCVDAVQHANDQLVFFQDAIQLGDYPKGFVKVPCFNDKDKLLECLTQKGAFVFSLEDSCRFVRATGMSPVQGALVYKEIKTEYFWYKDMLHKTHYEVFDRTGHKHLGEADLMGQLDKNKADKTKRLK